MSYGFTEVKLKSRGHEVILHDFQEVTSDDLECLSKMWHAIQIKSII